MGGKCGDGKAMEENIYWKCFKCVQFSQILSGHFQKQLEIPKKFAMNLREKLGEVVSLKVPSGAIWEVRLENESDSLTFKSGWKQFITDNGLKENDIVIFKYNGSSVFDVLFFDGKSLCEKEDSYFVRKCDHPDMAREKRLGEKSTAENTPRKVPRRCQPPQDKVIEQVPESSEAGNASEDDDVLEKDTAENSSGKVLLGRQPPKDKDIEQGEESFEAGNASGNDNVAEWKLPNKSCKDDAETPSPVRERATSKRFIRWMKRNSAAEKVHRTPLEYYSNRRPVTEEEKANAQLRANAETSIESLVIVMKEYNVYRRFFLTLPSWWSNDYLPKQHVIMKLQLEGKIWHVKFNKRNTGGVVTSGWKMFALGNSLEEGDVCVFNIISENSNPIVIEVKIFRVVEEVVPPTPLCPQSSSLRGRGRGRGRGRELY